MPSKLALRPRDCVNRLVVEEVVTNISAMAYDDQPGQVELRCRRVDTQRLLLEFIDCGRPFDILAAPPPDLTVDLTSVNRAASACR